MDINWDIDNFNWEMDFNWEMKNLRIMFKKIEEWTSTSSEKWTTNWEIDFNREIEIGNTITEKWTST